MSENSPFILIVSSFAGALSAVITFGFLLRDRILTYLRQQNDDLFTEITKLSDEMRIIRKQQHDNALHLVQQDVNASKNASDVLEATSKLTN